MMLVGILIVAMVVVIIVELILIGSEAV